MLRLRSSLDSCLLLFLDLEGLTRSVDATLDDAFPLGIRFWSRELLAIVLRLRSSLNCYLLFVLDLGGPI